ncbi:uncharacterized protein isoform X1 [Choristoneura fumiferana]|uniref:uncharacterized protein isoform X1 n=2 Tax=Choristoneura fumiferana TaxID=7141 RepID=UPI003D15DB40
MIILRNIEIKVVNRMESFSGAPVFIDVERNQEQFLLAQEICRTIMQQEVSTNQATIIPVAVSSQNTSNNQTVVESTRPSRTRLQSAQKTPKATDQSCPDVKSKDAGSTLLTVVPRRIRCPECHRYTAENEEKMLRHIKKVHKGENPFQCYMCDYSTYNKSLFEEHVRIHQGIKPFKCTQCDYKSASKKNLKKHELIHRPNNPLKCNCGFIARHPRALKRHEESHITGEWLKFDSCRFKFRDIVSFEKHKKMHKAKCHICEYTSCSKMYLKRHLREEHSLPDNSAVKKEQFTCQICGWMSSTMAKILLHLIHHPKQEVDESIIDISILRKHGIMT